jgi:GT2 family glycosyltransferase
MEDTTVLIKTILRPSSLRRLVRSIRAWYPDIRIIIGDDSPSAAEHPADVCGKNVLYVRLPTDCGLSSARNQLVELATTPYVVIADDDFEFTSETNLERFRFCSQQSNLDIVGGNLVLLLNNTARMQQHAGLTRIDPEAIYYCEQGSHEKWVYFDGVTGLHYDCLRVDITLNFFFARREALLKFPWDESLKLGEHHDFFLDAKGNNGTPGLRIGYCPSVSALHHHHSTTEYSRLKNRILQYQNQFMQKRKLCAMQFDPLPFWQ